MIKYIGIIGVGVLGNAVSTVLKSFNTFKIIEYDKYKNIGHFCNIINTDLLFICLPTPFDEVKQSFDKTEIENIFKLLNDINYKGIILFKSTVEPGTTYNISINYPELNIIHNPEFLSAKTAVEDFKNQHHIILGILETTPTNSINNVVKFYRTYFNNNNNNNKYKLKISITTSYESETVKLCCNSFYAIKVHYFAIMKMFCDKHAIDFENVKNCMIINGWINPQHTNAPGHDGLLSFGGGCFPKDIKAFNAILKTSNVPNQFFEATIKENKIIRGTSI